MTWIYLNVWANLGPPIWGKFWKWSWITLERLKQRERERERVRVYLWHREYILLAEFRLDGPSIRFRRWTNTFVDSWCGRLKQSSTTAATSIGCRLVLRCRGLGRHSCGNVLKHEINSRALAFWKARTLCSAQDIWDPSENRLAQQHPKFSSCKGTSLDIPENKTQPYSHTRGRAVLGASLASVPLVGASFP